MRSEAWAQVVEHRRWVIGALFGVSFLLGVWGWMATESVDVWTASYLSLRLFVLDGPDSGDVSLPLAWARFVSPIVASVTVVAVVFEVLGGMLTTQRAKWLRGHTVVLGGGSEAVEIALRARRADRGTSVVLVGEVGASEQAQLRRERVIHVPVVSDALLGKVLRAATLAIVSVPDDRQASVWLGRVRNAVVPSATSVITLLSDGELADDWRASGSATVLCRSSHVASAVLRRYPPYAEDAVSPSPMVIGDGRLAADVLRRIATGWQRPGERLVTHALGRDLAWVEAVEASLGSAAVVEKHMLPPSALAVPGVVREVIAAWRSYKPKRYDEAPANVYVSFDDDTLTLPIANAVARDLGPKVRVVALLDDPSTAAMHADGVVVIHSRDLLCEPAQLGRTMVQDLIDEIVADLGRWPGDVPSAFGSITRKAGNAAAAAGQTADVRERITTVAEGIGQILGRAGLVLTAGPGPLAVELLDPAELVSLADALGAAIGDGVDMTTTDPARDPERERRTRLLELAAALPVFLRRIGYAVVRADGRPDLLDEEEMKLLARVVHQRYLATAVQTNNATGSRFAGVEWEGLAELERRSNVAQAMDIPLKLAMQGLGWERHGAAVELWAFTGSAVDVLAEQEHRRWTHFEMRNARHDHEWNKPWSKIRDTGAATYDRETVEATPGFLARVGVGLVSLDGRPLTELSDVVAPVEWAPVGPESAEPAPIEADLTEPVSAEPMPTKAEPRRFVRRGRVWAWPLAEPRTWVTPRGDRLTGQAGDWWVVGEDGSMRTVDAASFAVTHEHVAGPEYQRVGVVSARQVSEREVVATPEGGAVAEAGDWVVTDGQDVTWPVTAGVFESSYAPEG